MATIKPFSAIRPNVKYVDQVASLPYDVMSVEEAKEIVKDNPYAFLQIDLPEVFLAEDESEDSDIKYKYAKDHLQKLINEDVLEKDKDERYYIYQLQNETITQRGIVGVASVEEYNQGIIKKHENTRADKEADRIKHVDACNAHTGPIFLAYKKNKALKQIIQDYIEKNEPIYNFTADDKVVHAVWKINQEIGSLITTEFDKIESLYIADGHHRAAAAATVGNARQTPGSQYFLSVAFDEEELCIMDYNRVVHDLNGLSAESFFETISKDFTVKEEEGVYKPKVKDSFGMYYDKKWYSLVAKAHIVGKDIVASLDVSVLQDHLLNPVLGIKEPRTDNRIEFIGGIRGLGHLEKVADQYNGIAFAMFPTSIQELMAVADINELMPPKSTWFEPKLRSGIFINDLG
ncbi:MAG TPA: DUF1015 domain-containing protein [Epulopiscium sp.]|nr:DUF1015 domain-containing protein [Candidatus Epulonipiscium sp.]